MITKGVSISPIRGNIYDSAGQQIAYSISTQSLYFTFKTGFKQEVAEALAAKLVQLFNEKGEANSKPLTTEEVIEAMDIKGRTHLPFQQRRIKSGLSKEEIAYLSEHRDEYPDMEIVEERIRQYSPDRVAVQLVGYDGIELMYQKDMRGLNGINQITSSTLIVGVDIAKFKHVARAQDYRGVEFGKPITFENNREGFELFVSWFRKIATEQGFKDAIVGMDQPAITG